MSEDKTNFQKVIDFNDGFGVPVSDSIQTNIFKENPKLVKLRLDLILEEVRELTDAAKEHDMVETIDALADILYVVYGAGASFGIDLDKAFDIVHQSNMSKLCMTEEDAVETVRIYKETYEMVPVYLDLTADLKYLSVGGFRGEHCFLFAIK